MRQFFRKAFIPFLLISTIMSLVQCGMITNNGFDMNFNNEGFATQYILKFSVETALPNNASLRLTAPYNLGDTYSTFTQAGTWMYYTNDCASSPTTSGSLAVRASQVSGETNTYYIMLNYSNGNVAGLNNTGTYSIYLDVDSTVTESTASGYYIALATVLGSGSSTETNLIAIDKNDVFDYIAQGPNVITSLNYNYTAIGGQMNDLAGLYNVQFSFGADRNLSFGTRFRLQILSTEFSFAPNSCINTGSIFSNIGLINPSNLTYTYTNQTIDIAIASPLTQNQIVRFICEIQNPPYVAQSKIRVYMMEYFANNILAWAESATNVLNVNPTSWENIQTSLSWGYEISGSLTVERPLPIHLYSSYNTSETVYNTIYFFFNPEMDLPSQESLVFTCDLGNDDSQVTVIGSSIVTNLPSFNSQTPVTCARNSTQIICKNVGALLNMNQYFLELRFSIPSGLTPTLAVTLSVTDEALNSLIPATSVSINSTALTVTQSIAINPLIADPNNTAFRLFNLVHLIDLLNYETFSNTLYGLRADLTGSNLDLVFEHNFDLLTLFGDSTYNLGDGIEYFMPYNMNNSIFNDSSECVTVNNVNITVCEMNSVTFSPTANFTRFRFGIDPSDSVSFFPTIAANKSNVTYLVLQGFGSMPAVSNTFYANDRLIDFFGRSVRSDIVNANYDVDVLLTPSTKEWLINSYVVTSNTIVEGQLTNLVAGFSQYWASSTGGNDASAFPTVIRILGNLYQADGSGIQALSVFFQGLTLLEANSNGTYSCASSFSSIINCYIYQGDSNNSLFYPYAMNRLDIDLSQLSSTDYNNDFQIIFPVGTVGNQSSVYIGLALQDTQVGNSISYLNTRRYKLSGYNYTINATDLSDYYDNNNVRIIVPSGTHIGDLDYSNTTKISPPLNEIAGNTNYIDGLIGASVQLCTIWNFAIGPGFFANSIPSSTGQALNDQCLVYNYSSLHCLFCPIPSNFSISASSQILNRFSYPYVYATTAPTYEYYLSYSYTEGNLSTAGRGALSVYFSPLSPKLRAKNLIIINDIVSDPVNLLSPSFNNRITFSFAATAYFPKNSIITISFSSTHPFNLDSPVTCLFINTYNSTCSVSIPNSDNITVTLSGSSDFSPTITTNIILTGLDILSISSPNTTYSYSYVISQGTDTLQTVWLQDTGTFLVTQSSAAFSPQFSLNHVSPWAYSMLSVVFTLPKSLFSNEIIQVDLGSLNLNSTNQLAELDCRATSKTSLASQCDTTTGTNILISFPVEIPSSSTINITLAYLFVPPTTITADYSASVLRGSTQIFTGVGNTITIDSINGINQQANCLSLTKKYNNPGDVLEIEFSYTLQNEMNYSTTLRIYFPPGYVSGLGYQSPYCSIANQYAFCSIDTSDSRILSFSPFNRTFPAGSSIEIKVYGIQQPAGASSFPIFLTHDLDSNFTVISEYAFVNDVAPNSAPAQLLVTFFSTSVLSVLTTTTYQFNFSYTASADSTLTLIAVNFPEAYGEVISTASSFGCSLIDDTDTSYTISNCTTYGSRIKVFLDTSATPIFAQNVNYTLYLTNVPNPANSVCNMSKIPIALVTTDETNTKFDSYSNLVNQNYLSINYDPNVKILSLYNNSIFNSLSQVEPSDIIQVIIGIYTPVYYIATTTGDAFSDVITFMLVNTTFEMIKDPFSSNTTAAFGDQYFAFRLGCNESTLPAIYQLEITKSESGGTQSYTQLQRLLVNAVNSTVSITPIDATATVGGSDTTPITFDLSENIPFDNLTITATIASNSTSKLSPLTSLTLVFNKSSTTGFFVFTTSSSLVLGSTATILLTLGGTNQDVYQLTKSWVTITIADSVTSGPQLFIRQPIVQNSTTQLITMYSSQVATIYWGAALYGSVLRDCVYFYNMNIKDNITYNSTDPLQEQFGMVTVPTAATDVSFLISNLRANASYQIYACALDQQLYNSTTQSAYWTMANNNSTIVRGELFFQFSLTSYQELQLCCFMSKYFSFSYEAVTSPNNYICTNSSTFNSISARRLPVLVVDIPDNFQGEENDFLFYGSTDTEVPDPRTTNVINAFSLADGSVFLNQLTAYISQYPGFPPLISIEYGGNLTGFASEVTGTLTVLADMNWVAMVDFQLDNTGFIYAIIDLLLTAETPSYIQVQQGLNASGLNAIQSASLRMIGGQNYSINFSALPSNTSYVVFFYTISEDQSIFSPTSGVYAIPVNTSGTDVTIDVWISGLKLRFSVVALLICLIVIIFV